MNTYATGTQQQGQHPATQEQEEKLTILLASDDLDRAFLAFMIATSSRAMGMNVNIFFALWGLNLLRRQSDQPSMQDTLETEEDKKKKSMMAMMMAMMMPKGPENARLSKMNFGGMGASMMKQFMKKSGAASLPELMDMAVNAGIEFTACTMTMDIMGFTTDDLLGLPNLGMGGVTSCIGNAMQSKMFLVI
jgi:peroxiredoxin family protein